jgi:mono/diheme cytochrome c family protein
MSERRTWTAGLAAAAAAMVLAGCSPGTVQTKAAVAEDPVARGEYLVLVAGCNDCHTPFVMGPRGPEPDMTRMLAGHPQDFVVTAAPAVNDPQWPWSGAATNTAFAGAWGVSFAPNLTPDEATGFGIVSEEMFINAMRTGKHWGVGRPILPPMPWQNYARMTDADLAAIHAYLATIPPIRNKVPEALPPS